MLAVWALACRPGDHQIHITFLGLLARYSSTCCNITVVRASLTPSSSTIVTRLLTKTIKDAIGHPRPDLIERCMPVGARYCQREPFAARTKEEKKITLQLQTSLRNQS